MPEHADDPLRVLVIDDEAALAETICDMLGAAGHDCTVATSGKQGLKLINESDWDVVVTDLKLGDVDGLTIVRRAKEKLRDAEVIVVTGFADVKTAVEALRLNASHYLVKEPAELRKLPDLVERAADRLRIARDLRRLQEQIDEKFGFEGLIGNSAKMRDVLTRLRSAAPNKATVLILGENGTGKELVAKALHTNSPRKSKPFLAMNCAALNENLLDDEMFGHEPHAFTGADRLRKGRFEAANGGTLFLDEIGDMPLPLQAKLLRVLENGEVTRIGSNEVIKVDVRLIAATNRDLESMIKEGKFRQDLYYRLKVVTLRLPALRERRDDIPLLTAHFIRDLSSRYGKKVQEKLSDDARQAFARYPWPGNVRELRNTLESMIVQDTDGVLSLDDLQEGEGVREAAGSATLGSDALIGRPLSEVERYYAERALDLSGGNRAEASKTLGIGERTLYRMITDWKNQDEIRAALDKAGHDVPAAASLLGLTAEQLEKKLKKLGQRGEDD